MESGQLFIDDDVSLVDFFCTSLVYFNSLDQSFNSVGETS